MSGMYPAEQKISIYGKEESWPGLKNGKFTNGDFNDPLAPPSFIPAETVNLILDNLNELIASLDGAANNIGISQLSDLFTAVATANKGIKRDENGRAKVAAPVEADDIARLDTVTSLVTAHETSNNVHAALIRNTAYPLGAWMVRYPGMSHPGELYGGTWSKVETDGYFPRFAGGNAISINGGYQGPLPDAVQTDTLQQHTHSLNVNGPRGGSGEANLFAWMTGGTTGTVSSGRTSDETRPYNKTCVLYKKTAL